MLFSTVRKVVTLHYAILTKVRWVEWSNSGNPNPGFRRQNATDGRKIGEKEVSLEKKHGLRIGPSEKENKGGFRYCP